MAANIYHFISLEIFKIKGSRNEECLSIYVTTIPHGKCFALFPRSFIYKLHSRNYFCILYSFGFQSLQDGRNLYSKQLSVCCLSIFSHFLAGK